MPLANPFANIGTSLFGASPRLHPITRNKQETPPSDLAEDNAVRLLGNVPPRFSSSVLLAISLVMATIGSFVWLLNHQADPTLSRIGTYLIALCMFWSFALVSAYIKYIDRLLYAITDLFRVIVSDPTQTRSIELIEAGLCTLEHLHEYDYALYLRGMKGESSKCWRPISAWQQLSGGQGLATSCGKRPWLGGLSRVRGTSFCTLQMLCPRDSIWPTV